MFLGFSRFFPGVPRFFLGFPRFFLGFSSVFPRFFQVFLGFAVFFSFFFPFKDASIRDPPEAKVAGRKHKKERCVKVILVGHSLG